MLEDEYFLSEVLAVVDEMKKGLASKQNHFITDIKLDTLNEVRERIITAAMLHKSSYANLESQNKC